MAESERADDAGAGIDRDDQRRPGRQPPVQVIDAAADRQRELCGLDAVARDGAAVGDDVIHGTGGVPPGNAIGTRQSSQKAVAVAGRMCRGTAKNLSPGRKTHEGKVGARGNGVAQSSPQ